jgi:hypothetical protein
MTPQIRHLHLVGATGEIRTAKYDGRDHLVVPVVAMVEGVVWASNSEVPEFVPAEELAETPQQWNGRGCFAGHPRDNNTQVTANTPRTLENSFGTVFDTSSSERILKTRRLEMRAYLDPAKALALGPKEINVVERLRAGERVEVSVGCYVEAEDKDGEFNGLTYHGIWHNIVSDHLAFLGEDEQGACSDTAGCGAPRAAIRHCISAAGIERRDTMAGPATPTGPKPSQPTGPKPSPAPTPPPRKASAKELTAWLALRAAESMSDADVRRAIDKALRAVEPGYMGIDAVYPDDGYAIYYVMPEEEWTMKRRSYTLADGVATLKDDAVAVEPTTTYEPVKAAASAVAPITAPIRTTGGHTPPKPAAARPQLRANCGCNEGDRIMEKTARAELIAALVTDKHSGFKDGDEAILEAASDARLEEFRSVADAHKAISGVVTRLETENRNTSARVKVLEDKLRAAESPMTEDDFRAKAPESIKGILEQYKAEEDAVRASLVSQLKDLGGHSEEDLKKKSTDDLRMLASYARVTVPDFSGIGVAAKLKSAEQKENYAPPNPYEAGIKALQASATKH